MSYIIMLKNWLLAILLPARCLGCRNLGEYICRDCLERMAVVEKQKCPGCKRIDTDGSFCSEKCGLGFCFDRLVVCLHYDPGGIVQKVIVGFKYKFILELRDILGRILHTEVQKVLVEQAETLEKMLLIPVPLHKKRLRYRGFNQAKELVDAMGRIYKTLDCLERNDYQIQQAKLGRAERLTNLENNFGVKKEFANNLKNRSIILVDDVATTCSTLNECSKVLKAAGVKSITALVLARG